MKIWVLALGVLMNLTTSCENSSHLLKKNERHLRVNIPGEPVTLDPRKGGDLVSSSLHFMLFEGLTRLNPDGTTSGAQAESIDISPDRKIYTFHLRNSKWSDGSPVTAYDFEKSWKDILDPKFPSVNAHLLYPIKNAEAAKKGILPLQDVGITVCDAKTLVVELEKPTPYFLELTSFCVLFPVSKEQDKKFSDWAYNASPHFVSNGPYKLKKWMHHDEIVMEKNPNYWEAEKIQLSGIHISMVSNEMTVLHMFENGDLDMVGMPLSSLPADSIPDLARKGMLHTRPVAGSTICVFNTQKFPFNNANLRRAFAYAINREAIVKNITLLNEQVATGPIPPILKNNKVTPFFKDNDRERAREFFQKGLHELGISAADLNGITYFYSTSELNHKIAQAIQHQWLDVLGVKVNIENVEHKILLDKLTKRDVMMAQTIWLAQYSDQMNILERYKSRQNVKNYAGWENERYAQLIDRSFHDSSQQERFATLEEAESIFVDEMPVTPIFHSTFAFLMKPYLKNVHLSLIGDIYFEKIAIEKEGK